MPIPLASGYWFFNAYTILFFCIPFLNILVSNLSRKGSMLVLAGAASICLLNLFPNVSFNLLGTGYNVIWFMLLYIVGAGLRLHPVSFSSPVVAFVYVCSLCILYAQCLVFGIKTGISYSNLFVFCCTVCLFILLSKITHVPGAILSKSVTRLSALSFGVYLFQNHPFVWDYYLQNDFMNTLPGYGSFHFVIIAAIVLYIVGTTCDWLRSICFRIMHIDMLADMFGSKIQNMFKSGGSIYRFPHP